MVGRNGGVIGIHRTETAEVARDQLKGGVVGSQRTKTRDGDPL